MERIERMARIFPQLGARLGRLRAVVHDGMDLTYNQYKTLLTIADRGSCTLGELGRELDVAMSSASQMVDRLVSQGWVDRTQDSDNRRQVLISLTPAGGDLLATLQETILAGYRQLFARLPEHEQEALVQSFETIAGILDKLT
ncbi:MAG: MarR family transcriptional regulator [Desulfuromonas sp.]|nr:MAG: MarR family transcriptional regulator [Desulfuromonas sp.]